MKHRTRLLLIFSTTVLLALVAGLGWRVWQQHTLARDSRNLAVSVTQAILSSGSAGPLIDNAYPEWLATLPADTISSYIDSVPLALGPLQELNSISGQVNVPLLPGTEPITADYQISLSFSQSEANAFMSMQRWQGQWRFTSFRVDAPLLYN